MKSVLIGKDPDARKDWGQEEKGTTEDEMVGWHHWLNGHEFEQTPGDSEGQGSFEWLQSWGHKVRTWPSDWMHFNMYVLFLQKKKKKEEKPMKSKLMRFSLVDIKTYVNKWVIGTRKETKELKTTENTEINVFMNG